MKIKIVLFCVSMLSIFTLFGCATPGETQGMLSRGQWTPAMKAGGDKYLIQGYNTKDALDGASRFCAKSNQAFVSDKVTPHTQRERATVIFFCKQ